MKRTLLSLLLLCCLAAPALAQETSQSDPPASYIVSTHRCAAPVLDSLIESDRTRAMPIMQALVNEGKLIEAGEAVHLWGDEYNLLTWVAAPDIPKALEGWAEMNKRYTEAYPADSLFFIQTCPEHRDYFYTRRAGTQNDNAPATTAENTPVLAISYYTCDYTSMGDLVRTMRAQAIPIAQALVDEGVMGSQGIYTHEWGDEWNLLITRTAADLPALLNALDQFTERYAAAHGNEGSSLMGQHCSAHKDNIYTIMLATD